jgi:hypothetical protein
MTGMSRGPMPEEQRLKISLGKKGKIKRGRFYPYCSICEKTKDVGMIKCDECNHPLRQRSQNSRHKKKLEAKGLIKRY